MMVSRRRWHYLAVIVFAATPAFVWGVDLPKAAADLEGAHGRAAIAIQDDVIRGAPPVSDPVNRDKYANDVKDAFKADLNSKNPEARLHAAIIIVEMGALSTDQALRDMLNNNDPAVRYWGAKGLGNIATNMKRLGGRPLSETLQALRDRAKKEEEGVVEQEIIRTLIIYGDVAGVVNGIERLDQTAEKSIPDRGTLDAITIGAQFIEKSLKEAPAEKQRAVDALARAASFAAQQQVNYKQVQGETPLPAGYSQAVGSAVDSSVKALNAATNKTFSVSPGASADELALNVGDIVGSGTKKGKLQAAMPNAAIPPTILTGATRPGG